MNKPPPDSPRMWLTDSLRLEPSRSRLVRRDAARQTEDASAYRDSCSHTSTETTLENRNVCEVRLKDCTWRSSRSNENEKLCPDASTLQSLIACRGNVHFTLLRISLRRNTLFSWMPSQRGLPRPRAVVDERRENILLRWRLLGLAPPPNSYTE